MLRGEFRDSLSKNIFSYVNYQGTYGKMVDSYRDPF